MMMSDVLHLFLQNMKFGFGGKKRWRKSNTAESSADMAKKVRKTPAGRAGGKAAPVMKRKVKPKRLGKSRRQHMKKMKR